MYVVEVVNLLFLFSLPDQAPVPPFLPLDLILFWQRYTSEALSLSRFSLTQGIVPSNYTVVQMKLQPRACHFEPADRL